MGRILRWILLVVALLAVSGVAFVAGAGVERAGLLSDPVPSKAPAPAEQFDVFWQAWNLVHEHFVDRSAVDDKNLTYGAIEGMIGALGDTGHTRFLAPEDAAFEMSEVAGQFEGIGAQVGEKEGYPVVVAPLDGSPAEKAGVQAGDIIVQVNGQPVAGMAIDKIVRMVRGPEGTEVSLTLLHLGQSSPVEVTIKRAKVQVNPVSWAMIPGTKIAHLRISQFTATAGRDTGDALRAVNSRGAEALILDVRSNPGGRYDQALAMASRFLDSGNVLVEQDSNGNRKPVPVARRGDATDLPLVLLVNLGTASAAEILAGAVQDNGRGKVVGETTFGTGTVLTPYELEDGSMLLLGTSQWLTPKGRQIWKHGITPDVTVPLPAGASPITPRAVATMSAEQLGASSDPQLLKAVELLSSAASPPV